MEKIDYTLFRKNIRTLRWFKTNLTARKLGNELGFRGRRYESLETEGSANSPKLDEVAALAKYHGVTIDALLLNEISIRSEIIIGSKIIE